MLKFALFFSLLFFLFSLTFFASAKLSKPPEWIHEKIVEWKGHKSFAFDRAFGWGTGEILRGKKTVKFHWFAFSNSDAYVQFCLDVELTPSEKRSVASVKDKLGRPWEEKWVEGDGLKRVCAIHTTWIGTTNFSGMEEEDVLNERWHDHLTVLSAILREVKKNLPFIKRMEVAEYL